MTKLDFPDTPSTGQQFGSSGTVWRWDGTRWGSTAGAAGARGKIGYAQIVANQTGIAAAVVDIAGLSVTWTADPTRTYRTSSFVLVGSTAVDQVNVGIRNAAGTVITSSVQSIPSVGWGVDFRPEAIETGLSGVQTRKMTVNKAAGTGGPVVTAAVTFPNFILVEDITYEAGSSGGSVGPGSITNAYLASMPPLTVKGNNTGAAGNPKDLTTTEVDTMLTISSRFAAERNKDVWGIVNWGGSGETVPNADKLLIQTAQLYYTADYYGDFTITFPRAFAAGSQVIVTGSNSNPAVACFYAFRGPTLSNISVIAYLHDGTPFRNGAGNISYTAIGRHE